MAENKKRSDKLTLQAAADKNEYETMKAVEAESRKIE